MQLRWKSILPSGMQFPTKPSNWLQKWLSHLFQHNFVCITCELSITYILPMNFGSPLKKKKNILKYIKWLSLWSKYPCGEKAFMPSLNTLTPWIQRRRHRFSPPRCFLHDCSTFNRSMGPVDETKESFTLDCYFRFVHWKCTLYWNGSHKDNFGERLDILSAVESLAWISFIS